MASNLEEVAKIKPTATIPFTAMQLYQDLKEYFAHFYHEETAEEGTNAKLSCISGPFWPSRNTPLTKLTAQLRCLPGLPSVQMAADDSELYQFLKPTQATSTHFGRDLLLRS